MPCIQKNEGKLTCTWQSDGSFGFRNDTPISKYPCLLCRVHAYVCLMVNAKMRHVPHFIEVACNIMCHELSIHFQILSNMY